jgi:CHASE2 domain-containing sensor protein
MRYHDFDLTIDQDADGTIRLESRCDAHGEYKDTAVLDAPALAHDATVLAEDVVARNTLKEIGGRLYRYTFASVGRNIEWHFGQCWGAAGSTSDGVRVRLRIEVPAMAVIPWEYIYSDRLNAFLGASIRTPIVRYLELPQAIPKLEAPLPLRILIVIPDEPELDTAKEKDEILKALQPMQGAIEATLLEGKVTRRQIAATLETHEYHVFHFIGHGDFTDDHAVLMLYDEHGESAAVDDERIAGLFRNHPTMKLAVLNSCRGGALSPSKPFVGMAAALVRAGLPAVVAMQYEIADDEAVLFASTLYRQLFMGRDKGRIEIAVSSARSALAEEFPDTRAVGLPVLFTHAREGVLFNLESGSPLTDLSSQSADRLKAVIRAHEQNLELLDAAEDAPAAPATREGATRHAAPRRATMRSPRRPPATAAARAELEALERARQRLRFRNWTIVAAVAVAVVLGLAGLYAGVQARFPYMRAESYVIAWSDLFHHHDAEPSVTLIAIDSATVRALGGPHDASWRGRHALVLQRLVAAGAPVVAFNLGFDTVSASLEPGSDSLAEQFRLARANGTVVVAAPRAFQGVTPITEPSFTAGAQFAANCVTLATGTAPVMTVASDGPAGRVLSLPLMAVAAFRERHVGGGDRGAASPSVPRLLQQVTFETAYANSSDDACGVTLGDTLHRMTIDYAPRHEFADSAHRISYLSVLRGAPLPRMNDALVVIGYENPAKTFHVLRGWSRERRFGTQVEVDAMNTILRGIRIAPLRKRWQLLVIICMAALGALAAYVVVLGGRRATMITAIAAVVAYFVAGAALYARHHLLLNTTFDLAAFAASFIAVHYARRTWFS